jgi:hypothetical protein
MKWYRKLLKKLLNISEAKTKPMRICAVYGKASGKRKKHYFTVRTVE